MASKDCIVLIRRFIKPERADEFIDTYLRQPPVTAEGFVEKWLTRPTDGADLPPGLSGFHVNGNPGCVTIIAVERWRSVDAFRAFVPKASTSDTDQFDVWPRQRVVLDVL